MRATETLFLAKKTARAGHTIRLGGVTIAAPTEALLSQGVAEIGDAVMRTMQEYPSLDRGLLISEVAKALGHRMELKVFGAIVGSKLRNGLLDVVPCAAITDKVFRVLVASSRLQEFVANYHKALALVSENERCQINQIRDEVLGSTERGMWRAASHLAGRLVLQGVAEYEDRFSVRVPKGLSGICDGGV